MATEGLRQYIWEVNNGWRWRPRFRGHRGWDAIWAYVAYLMPRKLVYWCLIRAGVQHIRYDELVPAVPFTEVLSRVAK